MFVERFLSPRQNTFSTKREKERFTTFVGIIATVLSTESTQKRKVEGGRKMKANLGKELHQLSPSARNKIYDRMDEELIIAQFNWIRMGIHAMSQNPKITKEDMLAWLAAFKLMYRKNSRFTTQAELDEYLTKSMDEIFGEGGFPDEYMRDFRNIGR
jgi:hypothetical protein